MGQFVPLVQSVPVFQIGPGDIVHIVIDGRETSAVPYPIFRSMARAGMALVTEVDLARLDATVPTPLCECEGCPRCRRRRKAS